MTENKLAMITTDKKKPASSKIAKRDLAKEKMDLLYLTDPDQFNPLLTALGRERVKRTFQLLDDFLTGNEKTAADLGTGSGVFAMHLAKRAIALHAVDIANTPLKQLEAKNCQNIAVFQDYIPHTTLESDFYDIVLGLDVIAYLYKEDYRLFFSELARLVKSDGFVIASTPIDIDSEDALQNFADLAESEFNIEKWIVSYNSLYIRLCRFFEAPTIFVKASKDPTFYEEELKKRFSINHSLFKFNTSKIPSCFWSCVKFFTNPILNFLKQSPFILQQTENICRFISSSTGISHAIFIGKRRKLFEELPADKVPLERKGKQQVWE